MLLKEKYHCIYRFMRKKENEALRAFFLESSRFGPRAKQATEHFIESRKARDTEFSHDVNSLLRKAISISPEFTVYVDDFLAERAWLVVPTDEDIDEIYSQMTFREKIGLLLN